jgi:hypothetical protein
MSWFGLLCPPVATRPHTPNSTFLYLGPRLLEIRLIGLGEPDAIIISEHDFVPHTTMAMSSLVKKRTPLGYARIMRDISSDR